jgi:hypothetical protein
VTAPTELTDDRDVEQLPREAWAGAAATVFSDLWRAAQGTGPHELPDLVARHGAGLGLREVVIYLVDLQQSMLTPFVRAELGHHLPALPVDSTVAGRCFQHVQPIAQDSSGTGERRLWLPLHTDAERVGVLGVTVDTETYGYDEAAVQPLLLFASVVASLVMTKTMFGDTIVRARRLTEMGLAAEIQWSLLPPRDYCATEVTIAGALEPAYDVGGDSIDYAVDDGVARFAVFDAMGHGLASAHLATLTISAYRNARRGHATLAETVARIDDAVHEVFDGDGFVTALLAELDTTSGILTWVNLGHPAPLLLREGRMVKELIGSSSLPFGLASGLAEPHGEVVFGTEHLQREDHVLLYTDGAVEGRAADGELFGLERLSGIIRRGLASGLASSEVMRRATRDLLHHQDNELRDDASMVLVHWHDPHPRSWIAPSSTGA